MWSDSVRAPSSAGGQPDDISIVWNTDDERDYSDYEYSPPSPMAHYPPYPGPREPLARFMADLPDSYDFDKLALNEALRGLPVPDSRPARLRTNGQPLSSTLFFSTTWFGVRTVICARLVASNGNVTCSTEGPRRDAIPSISSAIVFGIKPLRSDI